MEVVVRTEAGEAEVDVAWRDAGPTTSPPELGHLVARVTGRRTRPMISVDGRRWPAGTPLADVGLRRGSVIDTGPGAGAVAERDTGGGAGGGGGLTRIVVVAGQGAGHRRDLPPGRYRIGPGVGRGELGDGSVGATMIEITVPVERAELADLDDRVLVVEPAPRRTPSGASLGPPGADGTAAFNRPPRPVAEPHPPPISVPEGSRPIAEPRRFPLLALVAPLPVAVALAAALGHWRFLLVGLMSPVLLGANWFEERRSRAAERRRAAAADAASGAALRAALEDRHRADLGRARRAQPTLAEALDWMHETAPALWARRADHPDAFTIPIGIGPQPWSPPLVHPPGALGHADQLAVGLGSLPAVPVAVGLGRSGRPSDGPGDGLGGGLALVGPADATAAVARGVLLVLAALHGPADVRFVVAVDAGGAGAWEWVKWLPHAVRHGGAAVVTRASDLLAAAGPHGPTPPPVVVAVGASWWHGRDAPLRRLLAAGPVRIVGLCEQQSLVPAACTTVVDVPAHGRGRVDELTVPRSIDGVALNRLDLALATGAARALARLHDPEGPGGAGVAAGDSSLTAPVALADLLGLPGGGAEPGALAAAAATISERWGRPARRPRVPIGTGADGSVCVDLIEHGPHGLIAGTTGSGKSELLRTLVVGLAATLPPEELNVVLVDFKGGAAFDACARLPHVVGLVTDLDEHLAARVLRCLGAEITHRERVLRSAGRASLDDQPVDADSRCGLARLVLVVDEFALLAAQLPEFVPGLVDIAQRGRSLGVHLVLATQRPAGVVDAKIRANTNLRIALRVQDDADSLDVIGTRAAASIPRHTPGRAIARFGVDELVAFQTAPAGAAAARPAGLGPPLTVRPFVAARSLSASERRVVAAAPRPADAATPPGDAGLRGLVDAVAEAAHGRTPPRRPYVDPLPDRVDAAVLDEGRPGTDGAGVVLGLEDRPAEQRHCWRRWRPAEDGCLALYGMAGAGTSSALLTLALGLARTNGPDDLHLYAIDADAGLLSAIAPLPHTGAVVSTGEPARLVRLARLLDRDLERRRRAGPRRSAGGDGARPPTIVVLVDNVGSLRQALDATGTAELWGAVERLLRDGPSLGIVTAVTATAERDLPPSASAHIAERLVLRQPAGSAYASFGFRPTEVPRMVPGRALCPDAGTEIQLLAPPADPDAAVDAVARGAGPAGRRPPPRVEALPARVDVVQLRARAAVTASGWLVPVGIGLQDADALDVELRPGAPFVIVGPAGSGRTTVLGAMAASVRAADPGAALYCLAPRSELTDGLALAPARPGDVADWVAAVVGDPRRRLLLVDDADAMDGPSLERLAALDAPGLVVVIAGRPDGLRRVGHWSRPWLRRGRGIVLSPVPADGDVLGVALPARLGRCPRGQGLLVDDGSVVPLLCASGPRAPT